MSIPEKIKELVQTFCSQGWDSLDFLTEDDVRCKLFSFLESKIEDNNAVLHSEVRWYGDRGDGKLKYRSDLVCIDKESLEERSGRFVLPSKGYAFDKFYGLIEIKFRRPNGDSNNKWKEKITADLDKVQDIKSKVSEDHSPVFLVLAFDKKTDISNFLPQQNNLFYKFIS